MSTTAKKPVPAGPGRITTNDSGTSNNSNPSPSSRQPRSSASTSTPTSASAAANATTPSRTRSIRGGTPVSARAAAHRSTSSLSMSSGLNGDSARAETVAIIDDLKERLAKADAESEQHRKQGEVLQSRLDEALKEQAKLEERVHENEEQIESLRNEKRDAARQMREMETIYEGERSAMLKEKEAMSNREEEMQSVINRLKETLNQRNADDEYRPTRSSSNNSPNVDSGGFAPPSSVSRSDSRNNSKIVLQKDKLIESLRLELAEAQIKLVESENQGGGRLHEVERLLMEARMANARLMEDNESYQLLLQEKTLHGDFGKGDFDYMGGVSSNQDALNALEGRNSTSGEPTTPGATSLADELGSAREESPEGGDDHSRRVEAELRAAKDQNKALTLYINKIIERLLQHQEFEHILDQSSDAKPTPSNLHKDLPAPPSEAAGIGGFLQRAKSMAIGTGGANNTKPRPRPTTMMPTSHDHRPAPVGYSNPDTAPSIPIGMGRSQSVRRGRTSRPMSEQITGAAGVVNAMYKGPDGPISPTLGNARHSQAFFSTAGGGVTTPRMSSTGNGAPSAGNFPGASRSETSSVSGDSVTTDNVSSTGVPSTNDRLSTTSGTPPRSISGGDRTLAGNKPRQLRLVQEANESKAQDNKRSSWMNWPQWSKKEENPASPPHDTLKEN